MGNGGSKALGASSAMVGISYIAASNPQPRGSHKNVISGPDFCPAGTRAGGDLQAQRDEGVLMALKLSPKGEARA